MKYSATLEMLGFQKSMNKKGIKPKQTEKVAELLCKKLPLSKN